MAGISTGGGGSGKKAVDHSIPLVPFIDLLLCCVMFLLVTAVWNQLARIATNQKQPGAPQMDTPPPEDPQIKLILQVQKSGYVLATTAGERTEIPMNGDAYDVEELITKLKERRQLEPNRKDIDVAPEDGVLYADVVKAMDVVVGEGYEAMSLTDGASL